MVIRIQETEGPIGPLRADKIALDTYRKLQDLPYPVYGRLSEMFKNEKSVFEDPNILKQNKKKIEQFNKTKGL